MVNSIKCTSLVQSIKLPIYMVIKPLTYNWHNYTQNLKDTQKKTLENLEIFDINTQELSYRLGSLKLKGKF